MSIQEETLKKECLDFAIRIIEAKGNSDFNQASNMANEAIAVAKQFEEYIHIKQVT